MIEEKKDNDAVKSNISNSIIFLESNKSKSKIFLNGDINVNENLIFNDEVELEPGTNFIIKPDKHIIFKKSNS